ncbi:hypothetical protein ACEWPL_017580 [Roseovarius sp. S1116L3]|uniref:hypothetical protein n=1 Tax=Roseovarius roseus TaxID=3342636 RepID=UPI00372A108A
MADWLTSSEPLILSERPDHYKPLTLQIEVGSGTVEVQRLQSDGVTWSTIEVEGTLTASGIYKVDRSNSPELRIIATGDAKFSAVGK